MNQVARGYGKLLLFGEHAAVYGYPALGIRLPQTVNVSFEPGGQQPIIELDQPQFQAKVLSFLEFMVSSGLTGGLAPGRYRFGGNLSTAGGLGSSAAFCVAMANLYLKQQSIGPNNRDLWRLANGFEQFFHHKPSGIDTGLSIWGGPRLFTTNTNQSLPNHHRAKLPPVWLVYSAVARQTDTKDLVYQISQKLTRGNSPLKNTLAQLGNLSTLAADCHSQANGAKQFGQLANRAHKLLRDLNLSTADLDWFLNLADNHGSLGGKLSGAGGGGAFWSIAQDQTSAGRIATAWASGRSPNNQACIRPQLIHLQ